MATEDEYLEAIGRGLCNRRVARGWSQEQAAREVEVSVSTWRAWETGRREPYATNWQRLSDVFGVPVSALREVGDATGLEARLDALEARVSALERKEARD